MENEGALTTWTKLVVALLEVIWEGFLEQGLLVPCEGKAPRWSLFLDVPTKLRVLTTIIVILIIIANIY